MATIKAPSAREVAHVAFDEAILAKLRADLPAVADATIAAVVEEVAQYADDPTGSIAIKLTYAVQQALRGFLRLAARPRGTDPGTPMAPTLEAAYALGRGEARSGRNIDALLSAYRIGARAAWREWSASCVAAGMPSATLAVFAELVFAYIDELSAASVAGHSDELANTGRVRERHLEQLGQSLLGGATADELAADAQRAEWDPPETLTAVVLPSSHARTVVASLDPRCVRLDGALVGLARSGDAEMTILLVPDISTRKRTALLQSVRGLQAYVGPARDWMQVRESYLRARRALDLDLLTATNLEVIDTDRHLPSLILQADPAALDDLRTLVLAPIMERPNASADRLTQTLRLWLLHHGRRDEIAAALHVHPQTVRYRVGQLRELYGDRLVDPEFVLALTLALAIPPIK